MERLSSIGESVFPQGHSIQQMNMRCPCPSEAILMMNAIRESREEGDSLGGTIQCLISGLMSGLGEPVFDKFEA